MWVLYIVYLAGLEVSYIRPVVHSLYFYFDHMIGGGGGESFIITPSLPCMQYCLIRHIITSGGGILRIKEGWGGGLLTIHSLEILWKMFKYLTLGYRYKHQGWHRSSWQGCTNLDTQGLNMYQIKGTVSVPCTRLKGL